MITAHPVLTIELTGSYVATHLESGTAADLTKKRNRSTTKSPIPVLCRLLLDAGHDGETRVHIVRKAMSGDRLIPVFKRDRTLVIWSGLEFVDNERRGPHQRKYVPYSGPVGAKEAVPVAEVDHGPGKPLRLLNAANANTANDGLVSVEVR